MIIKRTARSGVAARPSIVGIRLGFRILSTCEASTLPAAAISTFADSPRSTATYASPSLSAWASASSHRLNAAVAGSSAAASAHTK